MQIEAGIYSKLHGAMAPKVTASELGAVVHDEIRWSSRIVVVDHKFIVVQSTSRGYFRKNLTLGQYPRYEPAQKYPQSHTPGAAE